MTAFAEGTMAVAAASNAPAILAANLARSPCIAEGAVPLHVEADPPSAAVAYNRAIDATAGDWLILAHHDVFLPRGWDLLLRRRIAEVEARDPHWGVIGAFGVGPEALNWGPVWSSSVGAVVGLVSTGPVAAQCFDELLLVLNRAAGLRFDEGLPHFHLYGADIAQTARAAGRGAWQVALPLVHNDRYHDQLEADFAACYRFIRRKWRAVLPIKTPVTKISASGRHLWQSQLRNALSRGVRRRLAAPPDIPPQVWAERCGWTDLTAAARA